MSSRTPLYPRLLRLRHVHPNGWQRAALGEGAIAVAAVLVLADLATAWTLLVLPIAVAVVVKAHDLVAGALARSAGPPSTASPAAPQQPSAPREVEHQRVPAPAGAGPGAASPDDGSQLGTAEGEAGPGATAPDDGLQPGAGTRRLGPLGRLGRLRR